MLTGTGKTNLSARTSFHLPKVLHRESSASYCGLRRAGDYSLTSQIQPLPALPCAPSPESPPQYILALHAPLQALSPQLVVVLWFWPAALSLHPEEGKDASENQITSWPHRRTNPSIHSNTLFALCLQLYVHKLVQIINMFALKFCFQKVALCMTMFSSNSFP